MEEARQARAKTPEPRVPVVSRPTAARTQHMAEIARALSTRQSSTSDDRGRVLCPAYPASTLNAPVPRVLAEAHEEGTRRDGGGGGGGGGGPASWDGAEGGGGRRCESPALNGEQTRYRWGYGVEPRAESRRGRRTRRTRYYT